MKAARAPRHAARRRNLSAGEFGITWEYLGVNGIAEPTPTKSGKNEAGADNKAVLALCAPGISPTGMLAFGTAGFETTGLRYGWRVARRKTIGKRAVELHLRVPVKVFSISIFVLLGFGYNLCCRGHGFALSRRWADRNERGCHLFHRRDGLACLAPCPGHMSFGENARRREDNLDQSALMLLALDRKGGMIGLDQGFGQRQAQSRATRRPRRGKPPEGLEGGADIGLGHACPRIANANNGASRVSEGRGDDDMAARLIELHRI